VTILHHEHHIGFERLVQICREVFHLPLSEGGAVAMVQQAGQAVQAAAEAIWEQVRRSANLGRDETSVRVQGKNWWHWVFVGGQCEYHLIVSSRGYDVIESYLGECEADVWVENAVECPGQAVPDLSGTPGPWEITESR
jgi:transposase